MPDLTEMIQRIKQNKTELKTLNPNSIEYKKLRLETTILKSKMIEEIKNPIVNNIINKIGR